VGPFESFYESALQHPILLWAAAALGGAWALTRPGLAPSLRRYCGFLVVLSLLDAWLTARHVYGVGALSGVAARGVPLFFVLAGDARFLLLLGAASPRGEVEIDGRRLLVAGGLTLIVPLSSQIALAALPSDLGGARVLFLVYELAFAALALALLRWHPGVRAAPWLATVSRFVVLYYGLWASADAIILATGSDLGFGLRLLPNALYYGGLIGVIGWAGARASGQAGKGER